MSKSQTLIRFVVSAGDVRCIHCFKVIECGERYRELGPVDPRTHRVQYWVGLHLVCAAILQSKQPCSAHLQKR